MHLKVGNVTPDINAEAYETHDGLGVCGAGIVCYSVHPTFCQRYTFGFKLEAEVDYGVAINSTFVDA